ncbi:MULTISPECIES: nucleotidyltransferase family protein [unclassified Mesorhizobium]|uniref:nucleotidyltransferase family protein n=1 Tax=unclassified Mesorhizobium TaxID=325217 RepID=UPI001FE1F541|nr:MULTISPECIES: nucleotidyltransferase family protein [unclassified Mesorhizobium]
MGLARNCAALPRAFYSALERCVLGSPKQLLTACSRSHQVGLLGESLELSSLSQLTPPWLMESIEKINATNRLLFDVFETTCLELEYLCSLVDLTPVRIKGLSACRRLYADIGSRPVRDIDVLIERGNAEALYKIALTLGFVQGRFDSLTQTIVPVSTSIDLNSDYEFPRMVRAVQIDGDKNDILDVFRHEEESKYFFEAENPLVVYVPLEIHFDLDLPGRIPWRGSKEVDLPDQKWHHLLEDDEVLYLCFKAYADIEIYRKAKGIKLISDIHRLLRRSNCHTDQPMLRARALQHGLQVPVDWVLQFLGKQPDATCVYGGLES